MRNLSQEFDFNPKFDFGRKKLRSQISAANGMHIGTVGRCLRLWTTLKRNKVTLMLMRGHLLMLSQYDQYHRKFLGFFERLACENCHTVIRVESFYF